MLEARALLSAAGTDTLGVAHTNVVEFVPINSSPPVAIAEPIEITPSAPVTIAAPVKAPPSAPVTIGTGTSAGNDLSGVLNDTTPVTTVNAIAGNNTGNVVLATFTDAIPQGGLYTFINVPGATYTNPQQVSGSNIVGTYSDATGNIHAFLYNGSTYLTLDVPAHRSITFTGASGDNFVGSYEDLSGSARGFLFEGTTFIPLDVPGAKYTLPTAVSGSNVVGRFVDMDGHSHGFLYDGSTFTLFDLPGATSTEATGVDGNKVVGDYVGADGQYHGFLYDGTTFTTLDYPSAGPIRFVVDQYSGMGTGILGISGNNIFGRYFDAKGNAYVFVLTGSTFTTLDPWAGTPDDGPFPGIIRGVSGNDIVGTMWWNGQWRGYLMDGSTFRIVDPVNPQPSWYSSSSVQGVSGSNLVGVTSWGPGFLYQLAPVQTDFTPTIDWGGDIIGTPTVSVQLVSQSAAGSTWEVIGNVTYADPGNYTATVTLTDATGSRVQTSNTTIAVAAGQAGLVTTPPAPALMQNDASIHNSDPLKSFYFAGGTADYTPVSAKPITPVVLLGLDGTAPTGTGTPDADTTYWLTATAETPTFLETLGSGV